MKINEEGLALIKDFEGCKLQAYKDVGGIWTVGYGHVNTWVKEGVSITQEAAENILLLDIERFEKGVNELARIPIMSNQFSALVCLAFNIGLGALKKSTLLKKLNQVDFQVAADEFLRWDKVQGKSIPGLARRRAAERALFLKS